MLTRTLFAVTVLSLCRSGLAADTIPHPEHPRPDFRREPWVNLNGVWKFDFDPQDAGEKDRWFEPGKHAFGRQITVPFPWEAKLSGIGDTAYQGVAWYAREITMPAGPGWDGKDAWLVVGACDWEAKVWVNGQPAGEHVGGYVPFAVNLTRHARPGEKAFVVIRAKDVTDGQQPTGKQIGWYTRTSGIWQTVYLEPRGPVFIDTLRFTCKPDTARPGAACPIRFETTSSAKPSPTQTLELVVDGAPAGQGSAGAVETTIPDAKLWTPDAPKLYDARLVVRDGDRVLDEVHTYFGLRTVDTAKAPGRDYRYIRLNGKPIYLRGALHQSFHPDGIHQYPDDAAVRRDYEICKEVGLNMLRIHIKIPTPRELYWADTIGILIMQDMPCYWKHTDQAVQWWEDMLRAAVARDFNHPSIFAWVDFNETWGIGDGGYSPERHRWVAQMWRLTKELDPTRLAEDNSPCNYDHVVTDINSWHFYINDYTAARRHIAEVVEKTYPGSTFNYVENHVQDDAPLMNSEYGGIAAGSGDQDISWCFKYLTNELRRHDKICGYIYTELSDIEWEHNGFANYDRSAKEYGYEFWHPGFSVKDLNNPDFIVLDAEPCLSLKPGAKRDVPVAISHWSDLEAAKLELRWRQDWIDRFGERKEGTWQRRPAKWTAYTVVAQEPLVVEAPEAVVRGGAVGALLVELTDGEKIIARNYLNVSVAARAPRIEATDAKRIAMRFQPVDCSEWQWEESALPAAVEVASEKVSAAGSGYVEYTLQLPEGTRAEDIESIELVAELAARAGDEKLDWPSRRNKADYPQTDVKKSPSEVVVTINGVEAARLTLPDDPADARGALSHLRGYHPGSYGFLRRIKLEGDAARKAADAAGPERKLVVRLAVPSDAKNRGGLAVFGSEMGAYAVDPTCLVTFRTEHGLPTGHCSDEPTAVNRLKFSPEVVIPAATETPVAWRYTTTQPGSGWFRPEFDAGDWSEGKSGFGAAGTPNAVIGTEWKTGDIWLRKTFMVKDAASVAAIEMKLYHDDDAQIYLNGERVADLRGYTPDYVVLVLDKAPMKRLRDGENVLAVHCRQRHGGQNVDVGMTLLRRKAK